MLQLEFMWIEEDLDGNITKYIDLQGEEFACRSAACAPPNKKGTGGVGGSLDKNGNPGKSRKTAESAASPSAVPAGVGRQFLPKAGAPGEEEMVKHLGAMRANAAKSLKKDFNTDLDPLSEQELATVNKRLQAQGSSLADWDVNTRNAIGLIKEHFPEAGEEAFTWYPRMNDWAGELSARTGLSKNQILAGTALTSTLKKWHENQEVVERIVKIYEEDKPFRITQEMADAYTAHSTKSDMGARALEAGTYKPSDLSTGTLARLFSVDANANAKVNPGAAAFKNSDLDHENYAIGGKYYTTGLAKAMAVLRGEISPDEVVSGPKQLNFYMNLAHPELSSGVTHDIWQARTYYGSGKLNLPGFDQPVTMREWEKYQKSEGTGLQANEGMSGNTYKAATGMIQNILTDLKASDPETFEPVTGNAMQAYLWVGYQKLYAAGLV